MNRITYLAASGVLVASSGLGAWAANAATSDSPAAHVHTTARHGADDPAGHHRHHGADDTAGHHRHHGAGTTARQQRHAQPEPGDDHGGLTNAPEPGDDNGGGNETEPGDDNGGANETGDDHGGQSGSDGSDGSDDGGHRGGSDD